MQLTRYKLGQLLDASRGASLAGEYYAEQGKLIRLTLGNFDLANGGFKPNISKSDIYFTGPVREEFILNKGDIITPLTEQTLGLLGSTARIPESGKYIQSQDVALIKCKENLLDPSFAYYLISSKQVRNQLSAAAQQTKIRHTTPDKLKDCVVDIPSIEEQRKIGKLLDSISEKIALNRQTNCDLEAMAKQLYDYWFVQFDFPNEEGKPYKSSGGKMVWNETLKREIPEGWSADLLGNIVDITRGTIITEKTSTPGDIKVVAAGLDFSYYHNVSNRKENCITISGSGENAGFVRFWREPIFASDCSTIQCDELIDTMLIFQTLKMHQNHFYRISHRSAQPHIQPSDIAAIPMIIVPKPIKDKLSALYEKVNTEIRTNSNSTENLIELRDRLLPLLMNGQVSIKQ